MGSRKEATANAARCVALMIGFAAALAAIVDWPEL
jgi:hypothetical protein